MSNRNLRLKKLFWVSCALLWLLGRLGLRFFKGFNPSDHGTFWPNPPPGARSKELKKILEHWSWSGSSKKTHPQILKYDFSHAVFIEVQNWGMFFSLFWVSQFSEYPVLSIRCYGWFTFPVGSSFCLTGASSLKNIFLLFIRARSS